MEKNKWPFTSSSSYPFSPLHYWHIHVSLYPLSPTTNTPAPTILPLLSLYFCFASSQAAMTPPLPARTCTYRDKHTYICVPEP